LKKKIVLGMNNMNNNYVYPNLLENQDKNQNNNFKQQNFVYQKMAPQQAIPLNYKITQNYLKTQNNDIFQNQNQTTIEKGFEKLIF
jgi:hypothetical protein